MHSKATFQHFISQPHMAPHALLGKLHALDHVIFLKNVDRPIIAFAAERYCVVQNNETVFYQKKSLNEYECVAGNLKQFIQLKPSTQATEKTQGAHVGFVGYDYAAKQQTDVKQHSQPALFLGEFQSFLKYTNEGWLFESSAADAKNLAAYIDKLLQDDTAAQHFSLTQPVKARWNMAEYAAAFQQVQDYIVAGDCYQINLTQAFEGKAEGSLLQTAEQFWQLTNAPYSGYLRLKDFELLSCSPELFIDFLANRKIITKPIKGTMPRYSDPVLDEQSKFTLKHSEKDQAENVMIVDLLRNDLSVYAETGSVKTPKLFNIESFNQVHHMVSEIEAVLKPDIEPFDVLMSALPGGSITGAPKIRAMQIIEELEAAPRGAYCGSMGYFNYDGTGSWNILIRSIQKYQSDISIWAGGGITIASNCEAEYQECFDKVEAMLKLLNTWHQPQ